MTVTHNPSQHAALLALAIFVSGIIISASVRAQSAAEQPSSSAIERVMRYLDQAQYILPGRGLGNIRIGMPLTDVMKIRGKPWRSERTGVLNRQITLIYKTGIRAYIRIRGVNRVEEIGVEGNTEYATPAGIRFGMPGHQIKMIYGTPEEGEDTSMRYGKKGIGFVLKSGTVDQINVFSPDSPG